MKTKIFDAHRTHWPWGLVLFFEIISAVAAYRMLLFSTILIHVPQIWPSDRGGAVFAVAFGVFNLLCGLALIAMMIALLLYQVKIRRRP